MGGAASSTSSLLSFLRDLRDVDFGGWTGGEQTPAATDSLVRALTLNEP